MIELIWEGSLWFDFTVVKLVLNFWLRLAREVYVLNQKDAIPMKGRYF
jgi:hypothetical protein